MRQMKTCNSCLYQQRWRLGSTKNIIYAVCGVLTACAMRVWCEDGELGKGETIAVGIFWPFFALMLVAVLIIKLLNKKGGKNEN